MSSHASARKLETYDDQPANDAAPSTDTTRSLPQLLDELPRTLGATQPAADAALEWLTTDERRAAARQLVETSARRDLLEVACRAASTLPKAPSSRAADRNGRSLRWRMVVSTTEATTSGTRELLTMMSRSGLQVTAHDDVPTWALIADDTMAIVSTGAAKHSDALLIRTPSLVRLIRQWAEGLWTYGAPLTSSPSRQHRPTADASAPGTARLRPVSALANATRTNGQPRPTATGDHPTPADGSDQPRRSTTNGQPQPTTTGDHPTPANSNGQPQPTTTGDHPTPANSNGQPRPTTTGDHPMPANGGGQPRNGAVGPSLGTYGADSQLRRATGDGRPGAVRASSQPRCASGDRPQGSGQPRRAGGDGRPNPPMGDGQRHRPDVGPPQADDRPDAASCQLLTLLGAGMKDEAIGRAMGISARTVRRRVADLEARFGAANRIQLVARAATRGWVDV